MFSELPKLFDRNFFVSYYLPVAVFETILIFIFEDCSFGPDIKGFLSSELLIGTTVIGLITWMGAIVLMALNREVYRILEGDGKYNPIKLLSWVEYYRYHRSLNELTKNEGERTDKHNLLKQKFAEEFPDREEFLMPTSFGNVVRAFEAYPRVMYGMESVDGWARLLAVIPKDYRELIDAAKSQVDFWVNLWLISIFLLLGYPTIVEISGGTYSLIIILILIAMAIIAPLRATNDAKEWGRFVKSAFDIYRFALLDAFYIDTPKTRTAEKKVWERIGLATHYRSPVNLPNLKRTSNSTNIKNLNKKYER